MLGLLPLPRLPQNSGPLPDPGRHSAAPEAAGALGTGSGECSYLRVHAPLAGAGCACLAAAESVYISGHAEEVELRTSGGRRD